MAQIDIAQTVSKMKTIRTATLGWDVVVSYGETEINKLLASDFRARDTRQIKEISCQVTGTDMEGDEYTIDFKFELSAPLISFSKADKIAVCNLAVPITGGYGRTETKNLPIKNGVYTMHFRNLELASASGNNTSYTPRANSFVFPSNADGFVVIDLRTSESLTVDIKAPEGLPAGDYNKFMKAHKASLPDKLKEKIRTDFLNVRYELARVKSNRPVAHGMVELVPRSFRFAAYEPGDSANSILSLFIQTRDGDNGEKTRLDLNWNYQWRTTLQCSPIPTGQTASIIFNKDMILDSIIRPALVRQGLSGNFRDTVGDITLDIDTKKVVHRAGTRGTTGGMFPTETIIDPIDVTPPPLSLKFYSENGSTIYCSRTWQYAYPIGWWVDRSYAGGSVQTSGTVTATHILRRNNVTSFQSLLDDYSVKMECSVDDGMWEVDFSAHEPSFLQRIGGAVGFMPQWVKDLNVKIPEFTIDLGSFDFFLTTNLLLPSRTRAVIEVDRAVGLKISGDLFIVGKVVASET